MASEILHLAFENDSGTTCYNTGVEPNGTYNNTAWTRTETGSKTGAYTGDGVIPTPVELPEAIYFSSTSYERTTFEIMFWFERANNTQGGTVCSSQNIWFANARHGWKIVLNGDNVEFYYNSNNGGTYFRSFAHGVSVGGVGNICFKVTSSSVAFYKNAIYQSVQSISMDANYRDQFVVGGYHNDYNGGGLVPTGIGQASWVDEIIFLDAHQTDAERLRRVWNAINGEATCNVYTTHDVDAVQEDRAVSLVKTTTFWHSEPRAEASVISTSFVEFAGELDTWFTYRLEKGLPLNDREIDRNFRRANMSSTDNPVALNGFITNHIQGMIYFGDIDVDDITGAYTGSGYLWALREGFTISQRVLIQ